MIYRVAHSAVAAAWAQAIGAVLAVVVAIILWRLDRSRAVKIKKQEEKDFVRRLLAILRVEVQVALETADLREQTFRRMLSEIQRARDAGITITQSGPLESEKITLTDAVIYRQLAPELGRIPASVSVHIVKFYARALEIVRIASFSKSAIEGAEVLLKMLPRCKMSGEILLAVLLKFEKSDFSETINLKLSPDEMRVLARKTNYPLEQVTNERGIEL